MTCPKGHAAEGAGTRSDLESEPTDTSPRGPRGFRYHLVQGPLQTASARPKGNVVGQTQELRELDWKTRWR